MQANDFNENKCLPSKGELDVCAKASFRECNEDKSKIFAWALTVNEYVFKQDFSANSIA